MLLSLLCWVLLSSIATAFDKKSAFKKKITPSSYYEPTQYKKTCSGKMVKKANCIYLKKLAKKDEKGFRKVGDAGWYSKREVLKDPQLKKIAFEYGWIAYGINCKGQEQLNYRPCKRKWNHPTKRTINGTPKKIKCTRARYNPNIDYCYQCMKKVWKKEMKSEQFKYEGEIRYERAIRAQNKEYREQRLMQNTVRHLWNIGAKVTLDHNITHMGGTCKKRLQNIIKIKNTNTSEGTIIGLFENTPGQSDVSILKVKIEFPTKNGKEYFACAIGEKYITLLNKSSDNGNHGFDSKPKIFEDRDWNKHVCYEVPRKSWTRLNKKEHKELNKICNHVLIRFYADIGHNDKPTLEMFVDEKQVRDLNNDAHDKNLLNEHKTWGLEIKNKGVYHEYSDSTEANTGSDDYGFELGDECESVSANASSAYGSDDDDASLPSVINVPDMEGEEGVTMGCDMNTKYPSFGEDSHSASLSQEEGELGLFRRRMMERVNRLIAAEAGMNA